MTVTRHEFRFHRAFVLPAALVGVRPTTTGVVVDDEGLTVEFGRWSVHVPVADLAGAAVTGPYWWPKVIGPPHLSLVDHGLTFATNPAAGTCIAFRSPVPGIEPFGFVHHPALTVTVEDPPALAELIEHLVDRAQGGGVPPLRQVIDEVHDELGGLTAAELRRRARTRGITRAASMTKAQLLEVLTPEAGPVQRDDAG